MNKRVSVLAAVSAALMLLTACAGGQNAAAPDNPAGAAGPEPAWDITMQDIIDANHAVRIFRTHSSIRVDYQYEQEPDWRQLARYADADIVYLTYTGEQDMLCRDGSGGYLHLDEDDSYGAVLDFTYDAAAYEHLCLDPDLTAQEEILSVEEDGDVLSVTTRLPVEAYRPYFPEGEFPYADGEYMEEAYTLNASDYAMRSDVSTLVHADGSREPQGRSDITYDTARPEAAAALLERRNTVENIRTGTIVLDPGTPEESSLTVTAVKGDYVYYTLPEGYETMYEDPACTIEDTSPGDPTADFLLYSKKTDG